MNLEFGEIKRKNNSPVRARDIICIAEFLREVFKYNIEVSSFTWVMSVFCF